MVYYYFWSIIIATSQQLQLCTQAPYMLVAIMVMVDGHPAIWRRGCRKIRLLRNLLLNSLSPSEQLDCSHGRHHLPSKEIFSGIDSVSDLPWMSSKGIPGDKNGSNPTWSHNQAFGTHFMIFSQFSRWSKHYIIDLSIFQKIKQSWEWLFSMSP